MTTLTSSLIVRLIDQVTGPARGVEESLQRINRAGGAGAGAAPSFADNMAAAQARVGTAIEQNNRALDGARGRLVDAVAGYYILDRTIGRTVRVAGDFQEAMNRVSVVSRANEEQLASLNDQARELGRTTQFTASQVADGMGFLAMAGFDAEQVMASMPDTLNLAAAGGMELGRSADIVSNILTGYGLQVADLERVTDTLVGTFTRTNTNLDQLGTAFTYAGPLAASAGMEFNETAAILGRMGDAGYQGSLGGTALRGSIIRLLAPTSSAAALMEELGVSVDDITDDGEDLEGALGEAEEAMRQIGLQVTDAEGRMLPFVDIMRQLEGHAEDAGLMARLFGARAGPAMAALLRQGSDSVRDLTEELGALDGEAARVAEERLRGYNGQMRAFRSAIEGVQIAIGTALLPALTDLIGRLTDLMKPVTDFLEANPRLTAAIVGTAAAMVSLKIAAAGLTFIGLLGKGGALSLLSVGLRGITALGTPVAGFFETLAMRNALATRSMGQTPGLLARIGDAARVLVRSVPGVGLIGKALLAIGGAVAGITAPVWAGIAAGVAAVAAGGALLWKYWDRVTSVLGGFGRRIMEELTPALEYLQPVLEFFSPVLDGISAAASGVASGFSAAGQAARDFIGWIGSFFEREVLSDEEQAAWGEFGFDAADRMIDAIKDTLADLPRWIAGGWAIDLFEAVTGIDLYEAGAAAVETIKRAFWDFLDWMRDLPSRVIAAIGEIDLSDLIRLPSPRALASDLAGAARSAVSGLIGGSEIEVPGISIPAQIADTADLDATLEAAREIARLRQIETNSSWMNPLDGLSRVDRAELARLEGDLELLTAGMPEAARADIEAFVAALVDGGSDAEAEAERLADALVEKLSITVTPIVDTSSIRGATSEVERLNSALSRTGEIRTTPQGGRPETSGHRRWGGPVWPGSSFLVGEEEAEIFTPSTGGEITPLSAVEQGVARMLPVIRATIARMMPDDGPAGSSLGIDPVEVASPEAPSQRAAQGQEAERQASPSSGQGQAQAPAQQAAPSVTMHNNFSFNIDGATDPQQIVREVRDKIGRELDALFRGANLDVPIR